MMKTFALVLAAIAVLGVEECRAQAGGNIGYSQNGMKARIEQAERAKRVLTQYELPPSGTSMFVEANVLMNVKADEYVVIFGVMHEGETVAECNRKMDANAKAFSDEVGALGIGGDDLFVDFVAQNRIYGYEIAGDIAREKLVGFELKKNVSIHYKDRSMLEKLIAAAAKVGIFDLIKVDYIVKDYELVQDRLLEEASRIIKKKTSRYEKLFDIKLRTPAQVYAERPGMYQPSGLYDSFSAYEAEHVGAVAARQKYTVQAARKSRTFFFNGLDADGFDAVLNPVITEPVVQFTLYLKLKYEIEQARAR